MINDPEKELCDEAEICLVYDDHEMEYWEKIGKAKPYPSKKMIRQTDQIHLESGEKIELLFKCP